MRKRIVEGSVLFISILKWVFLASCTGILVGMSTAVFIKSLEAGISYAKSFNYYFLLLPVALFLSAIIVKYLAPEAEGHGTEKAIEAAHRHSGRVNPIVVPVKLIATIITTYMGSFAGKEGPAAQIGAGLCSAFSNLLKFDDRDRKKLVICGISFGPCSFLFIEMLKFTERGVRKIKLWEPFKGLIGGAVLIVFSLIFSTQYLGLGLDTIKGSIEEDTSIPSGAFFLKMIFTSVTLSFGGSGGIITAIFFIGATAGNVFGRLPGFDSGIFSAIGMVSLVAGATSGAV